MADTPGGGAHTPVAAEILILHSGDAPVYAGLAARHATHSAIVDAAHLATSTETLTRSYDLLALTALSLDEAGELARRYRDQLPDAKAVPVMIVCGHHRPSWSGFSAFPSYEFVSAAAEFDGLTIMLRPAAGTGDAELWLRRLFDYDPAAAAPPTGTNLKQKEPPNDGEPPEPELPPGRKGLLARLRAIVARRPAVVAGGGLVFGALAASSLWAAASPAAMIRDLLWTLIAAVAVLGVVVVFAKVSSVANQLGALRKLNRRLVEDNRKVRSELSQLRLLAQSTRDQLRASAASISITALAVREMNNKDE